MSNEFDTFEEFKRAEVARLIAKMRPDFFHEGACRESGLDTFFLKRGESRKKYAAYDICASCPVKRACFDYALKEQIEYGIWAGTGAEQRRDWIRRGISADRAWQIRTSEDWK